MPTPVVPPALFLAGRFTSHADGNGAKVQYSGNTTYDARTGTISDEPFHIPPIPLMTRDRVRDVARGYQGLASHLAELGVAAEAARLERSAQWWLTYAIALAQTQKPDSAA